jgi:hypothetical protein
MGGVDVYLHSFLTSALYEVSGQPHASSALPPGNGPRTYWIGGWVGSRAGLDAEIRGKILCLCRGSKPGRVWTL